jgi:hypothetical protein
MSPVFPGTIRHGFELQLEPDDSAAVHQESKLRNLVILISIERVQKSYLILFQHILEE